MTTYDLFCDESGIDSGPTFYLGALRCSPARSRILATKLRKVRESHGLTAEMKWTRVSLAMLPAYKAFVDVFLGCPYSRFRLFTVNRASQWREFGRDEEERFFKAYYVFLRRTMSLSCRYHIRVDDKPGKRYRWSKVQYAINGAARRDYGLTKRQVRSLTPLDSKRCDLLQIVDVVLGSLASTATAPAKQEMARHIREGLQVGGGYKLVQRAWSPVVRESFRSTLR